MKKVLAILLVSVLLVTMLGGCGSSKKDDSSASNASAGDTSAKSTGNEDKTSDKEKKDPVTLTLWIWDDQQKPATQAMVDAFHEKYPWITVEITSIAGVTDYNAKMQSVIGTKDAPSVFWMNFNLAKEYVPMGFVQGLSEYMNNDPNFDISRLNAGITEAYTFDGEIYAVPKDTDSYAVFYNKAHFDAAGVPYPQDDWTIDDFLKAAQDTTRDNVIGWTNTKSDRVYSAFIYANGGEIYSEDGMESVVNSKEAIDTIQKFMDLVNNGYAYNGKQLDEIGENVAFTSKIAAMNINGSWMISQYTEALGDDLGIVEMPTGTKGKASVGHGIGYATTTSNPHMDETWLLLSYLGSDEAQEKQVEVVIPAANACASAWESVYPGVNLSAFVKALSYSRPIPLAAKNPTAARTAFQGIIANMLYGEYSNAEEAMNAAKEAMDAAINE